MYIDKDEFGYWIFSLDFPDTLSAKNHHSYFLQRLEEVLTILHHKKLFIPTNSWCMIKRNDVKFEFSNSDADSVIQDLQVVYTKIKNEQSENNLLLAPTYVLYGRTILDITEPIVTEYHGSVRYKEQQNGDGFFGLLEVTAVQHDSYFEIRIDLYSDFVYPISIDLGLLQLDLAKRNRPVLEAALGSIRALGWTDIEPPQDEMWHERAAIKNDQIFMSYSFEDYKKELLHPNHDQAEEVAKLTDADWEFIKSCCYY